jgi:hypothetical protein
MCAHCPHQSLDLFGILTDFSEQMLTFNDHWHDEKLSSSWMNPGFNCTRADGRQCIWRHVGEQYADVNVVNRVPHGGSRVIVWAGISYGQ